MTTIRALFFLIVAPAPTAVVAHDLPEARIDAIFAAFDDTRSPGCSLGIVQDGELVFARGYGMADLEHGVPLSSRSVFRIASASKQFTAGAVALLSLQGRVDLDDDVRRYLPELHDFGTPVTLRHLIHHTSGYRDYLTLMWLRGHGDEDYYDDRELLEVLTRQRALNFAPGKEHLYSNSGYWLLSQVVLRTTGVSLREFADEAFFEPLGMTETHFHDDPSEIVPRRAHGYEADEEARGGWALSMTGLPMIGDGGVFTTVEDLARWDNNFEDPQVGGPAFVELMIERARLDGGTVLDYATGLSHGIYRGVPSVGHGGAFVGFRAQTLRFPDQKTTFICLCNRADGAPGTKIQAVADIVLGDELGPPKTKSSSTSDRERESPKEAVALNTEEKRALVGSYYSEELDVVWRIDVTDDGELSLSIDSNEPEPLEALDGDRLRFDDVILRLNASSQPIEGFHVDAGRVVNLSFERR